MKAAGRKPLYEKELGRRIVFFDILKTVKSRMRPDLLKPNHLVEDRAISGK